MKESKDTDPGQEKKTQAGKDTQNSGKSTAQDDGSTAGPPVIWNRKMPSFLGRTGVGVRGSLW